MLVSGLSLILILVLLTIGVWWLSRLPAAQQDGSGRQTMRVRVGREFSPMTFRARPGVPLLIRFESQAGAGVPQRVIFPDFHLDVPLKPSDTTLVTLVPSQDKAHLFMAIGGDAIGWVEVRESRWDMLNTLLRGRPKG